MHIWEDAFLVEVIDPASLEPVGPGEEGELVLTTLERQAMPIICYRTDDLTRILPGECACGRVRLRLDRIRGRCDDMLIVEGGPLQNFPGSVRIFLILGNCTPRRGKVVPARLAARRVVNQKGKWPYQRAR